MKTRVCPNCSNPMDLEGLVYKCKPCLYLVLQHCPPTPFDASLELGWPYEYNGGYSKITDAEIQFLIMEAETILPVGCYFEIRARFPGNFSRDKELAWYYHPNMMQPGYLKYAGRVGNIGLINSTNSHYIIGGFVSGKTCSVASISTAEEVDCRCGHSWYDHIGWRLGTSDKRISCRIVRCDCEHYTESFFKISS